MADIQTEFELSWDRLSSDELDCIDILAVSVAEICPKLGAFLRDAVEAESEHRDSLKVIQTRQVPDLESFSDKELAASYMAAVVASEACKTSGALDEWGKCLLHTVCLHMAARLDMRHKVMEAWRKHQCERN